MTLFRVVYNIQGFKWPYVHPYHLYPHNLIHCVQSFMLCSNIVLIEIESKLSGEVRNGYGGMEEAIACILYKLYCMKKIVLNNRIIVVLHLL